MRMNVVRDKSGELIGTYEAGEIRTAEGTIEVSPEVDEGVEIVELSVHRHETFDIDSFHEGLTKRSK